MENLPSSDLLVENSGHTESSPPKKASNRKLLGLGAGLVTTAILALGGALTETVAQVLEVLIGSFMLGNSVEHIAGRKSSSNTEQTQG